MEQNNNLEEIKNFVSLQSKEVQENLTIVTPEDLKVPYALHIDKNTPEKFVPRMPKSAMNSENDTCARVTVAGTLLGCYIGYYRGETDVHDGSRKENDTSDPFLGGYTVCKLEFKHALKPSPELVKDANNSEEVWLVAYNEESTFYTPVKIGKLFVHELTYKPVTGKEPDLEITLYVENNATEGMWLDNKNKLDVGYWEIKLQWPDVSKRSVDNAKVGIRKLSTDEYSSAKSVQACMLSYQELPKYFKWK